jgi:hypothetical protein
MSRDNETLNLIQTTFPSRDQLIESAAHESRPFRDPGAEHRRSFAELHRWQQETAPELCQRRQEYTELLTELGREIDTCPETIDARVES